MAFCPDRRAALVTFLAGTRAWIEQTEAEARTELSFSAPGDFDYDLSVDQLHVIEHAKATVAAAEAELAALDARAALREG